MRIELKHVEFMPTVLEPGFLYVSDKYSTAAHLCACGCGSKIRTPLGPTEWEYDEGPEGVSLSPSIGNWQLPCKSHYWIANGEIHWSSQWSDEQIAAGRLSEQLRRERHYSQSANISVWHKIKNWFERHINR